VKIITAHQPTHLPWPGFFHKIAISDIFVWFDQVQYQKKEFDNRNKIKTFDGVEWLTTPVMSKNHFDIKLSEILIDTTKNNKKKNLKKLMHAYSKAEYYKKYIKIMEKFYLHPWEKLSDMNRFFINSVLEELNIKTKLVEMSQLNIQGKKDDLVLSMCKSLDTDLYVFGEEGRRYADQKKFENNSIKIFFQKYFFPRYKQLWGEFVGNLSIIDLMMNCGENSLKILMKKNISREELEKKFDG